MHRRIENFGRIAALIVVGSVTLAAQGTQTSSVSGSLVDQNGAAVVGATVNLTSASLQGPRVLQTDEKGRFITRLLPPGQYTITISKTGFQTIKTSERIGIDQTYQPRFTMAKTAAAVVEVVATAAAVDRTDVKTASNYSLDAVDALPNTRTMEGVALLTPGVTTGVGGRVQIRGAMTSGNLYLLDGQNISDNSYNNRGVRLIDDSIEEVQVITGAISAEYGSVDGGVLNAITRSGGNEFTGQLRWELSDQSWNAYNPGEVRGSFANTMNEEKTVSLSGFIIKDKLWFSGSFFTTDQTGSGNITYDLGNRNSTTLTDPNQPYNAQTNPYRTISNNGPNGLNAPYITGRKEIRRQIKLTYALNQNHTLVASFNNSRIDDVNRNYSAGELASLVPQVSTSEFLNLQWRAIWSNTITSEVKVGRKKQMLSAGADVANGSPVYNYTTGGYFNNGIFNNNDGGDNRDNKTFNAKVSMFWDAIGSHTTDIGVDYYKGTAKARNEQTATGFIFGVEDLSLNGGSDLLTSPGTGSWGLPSDVWEFSSGSGEANNISYALFVNDKWTMDKHLSFSIGVRYDKFKAENESGKSTAAADGISPRLGLKYDILGDGNWLFSAAWARYNSKVLEGITNSVTRQGNPTEIDHPWVGGAGMRSLADITNLANVRTNFDFTQIAYYNDPTLNVKLSDNLKAPTVDETQIAAQYFFNHPAIGAGSLKVTAVNKKWKNLFDYTVGNSGHVLAPSGDDLYMRVWENSDIATREYKGLEFEATLQKDEWNLAYTSTWSSLKGNYEGEASNSPAAGAGLKNFTVQDGVNMYDSSINTPYGYLQGHVAIRMRGTASRSFANAYGKTTIGLVYRFDTGAHYSKSRAISLARFARTIPGAGLSSQFGSSTTQYEGGRRMAGVLPSATYLDLAVTHEFPIFKVAGKTVTGFFKANIGNFLNHQQVVGVDTNWAAATSNLANPALDGLNSPWVPASSTYGKARRIAADYGTARTIAVSTGFRF